MWLLRSSHKHINQETLSEYLDGRLQGRYLERVEQGLAECGPCRQELEEFQATVAMVKQLPMETPSRSFVMSAPPPIPERARPALALRAPNWVYSGAASVAALALAVTVSVDATGGLSSDPVRQDAAATALSTAPASQPVTSTSGTATLAAESTSGTEDDGTAPPSLAAGAPIPAAAGQTARNESIGGAASGEAALDYAEPPSATTAPLAASAPEASGPAAETTGAHPPDSAGAEPTTTAAVPVAGAADGDTSSDETQAAVENKAAKSLATEAAPIAEPAELTLFHGGGGGGTSIWWRVLEAAVGVLAVAFLTALVLQWRANRRDSA